MVDERALRSYEFFISRAGADAEVAKEVADVLRRAGHTVQYQDEDIPLGANFIKRMSEMVENCKNLLIILSPAYLNSPYCNEEWTNFLADLFSDQGDRRVVVLLAQDCKPPGILRARVFGSLTDKSSPGDRQAEILAAAAGSAKRRKVLPPIFEGVPPHNLAFCGREDGLARLQAALIGPDGEAIAGSQPQAIIGQGGVGKSSLAAEYAYKHAGSYWGIWWVPAQSRLTLVASLAKLATQIDSRLTTDASGPSADLEGLAATALGLIRRAPLPWLLIYDNAESPNTLSDLMPPASNHVLITSRWPDWHGFAAETVVDVFTPEVAQAYLLERTARTDRAGAARLADAVEYLPLALEQAGALCKRTGIAFDEYRMRISDFIRVKPTGGTYPESVFGTFSLAIDHAEAACPQAEKLMSVLAFLAPDHISSALIGSSVMDAIERTAALEALTAVALLSVNSDGSIRIHRLVQEVMRQRTHVKNTYESTKLTIYEMLKRAFAEQKPALSDPIFEDALWCLHHDPDPAAALELCYENPPHYDVEADLRKSEGGVSLAFRVTDSSSGRPMHTIERRYYLEGGWKSELLKNWQSGH
jgi:hypothetical protein